MAVTFDSTTIQRTGTNYADYPENIVVIPELNGRHENTDVEQLAADILKNGQHTPVLFRKLPDGRPALVYGHRRFRAIALINQRGTRMKIFGNYESLTDKEALVAAIGENRFRRDVTPVDDAANINQLKKLNMTLADIAQIYFPEATKEKEKADALRWVEDRASLIELAPEAAKRVRNGEMKVTAAVILSKLSKDQQKAKLAAKADGRIKVSDVKPEPKKVPLLTSVKHVVESFRKDFVKIDDLDNTDNESISVDRKKLKKLFNLLGL